MISSVKIENLRSIKDSGPIEIKPITLLLGANSTGKSTFLRSFPLITQSVNKSLRGPISWFDSTLVDFGDFDTAKSRFALTSECIKFSYTLKFNNDSSGYRFDGEGFKQLLIPSSLSSVSFSLDSDNEGSYVKTVEIDYDNVNYKMSVDARLSNVHFMVSNKEIYLPFSTRFMIGGNRQGVLPNMVVQDNQDTSYSGFRRHVIKTIEDELSKWCDGRFKNRYRLHALLDYPGLDMQGFLSNMKAKVNIESLKKHIKNWSTKTGSFLVIYELFIAYKLEILASFCNEEIGTFYSNCSYIAPLRAEANRYYRNQELQVNDVDAYGRNLQEFISSLSGKEKEDYEFFMKDILKVVPKVTKTAGLHSVVVQSPNGLFNLADVGYGYSQVLPVLTKIWHSNYRSRYPRKRIRGFGYEISDTLLLMEQPELHLHPALQAKVADAMVNYAVFKDGNVAKQRLVVETHSQTIINRIGRRVREGKIDSNDINIVLFQKSQDGKISLIRQISFNENGQLVDWPWGFFDPED